MAPCSPELGLQQTGLSNISLRLPLGLPCSLIVHLPVGYLAELSLTGVGERSGLEDLREGSNGEGEVGEGGEEENGEEGEKCQQWVELEEGRLPGATKR